MIFKAPFDDPCVNGNNISAEEENKKNNNKKNKKKRNPEDKLDDLSKFLNRNGNYSPMSSFQTLFLLHVLWIVVIWMRLIGRLNSSSCFAGTVCPFRTGPRSASTWGTSPSRRRCRWWKCRSGTEKLLEYFFMTVFDKFATSDPSHGQYWTIFDRFCWRCAVPAVGVLWIKKL